MALSHVARTSLSPSARAARRHAALEHGTGTLADLIADARAIPVAAFGVSKATSKRVIDLTDCARHAVVTIPETAATLMRDAEQAFADYLR